MDLRPELRPPVLDAAKLDRLAKLAARIDGARPGQWEDKLAEFNRLAGTAIPFEEFQGISGGEDHRDWVRRILYQQAITPVAELSREEMIEIVSQVRAGGQDSDFYLEFFEANCRHPAKSDLIFWSNLVPELPQGREPTNEEIAELAMR